MPVATIIVGARYLVCGERLRALAWDVDDGAETWVILESAATGEPRYLVRDRMLERIDRQPDGSIKSVACDVTLDDVTLAVRPL